MQRKEKCQAMGMSQEKCKNELIFRDEEKVEYSAAKL